MNRKELKAQSKRLMLLATPHLVLMTLIMLAAIIGFSFAFLLFIIPGIIALLRYSQALYILAENLSKGIRQCVNESKAMMKGHLWEYFVLNLSFIPWILLTYITLLHCSCLCSSLYADYAGYYLHRKAEYTSSNTIS